MDIGTTYKTWSMCSILQWLVFSSSIISIVIKTFWFVWRLISTPVNWSTSCIEGLSFTSTLSPVGTRSRQIVLEFKVFQCTERAVRLVHAILPPALVCDHAFYYNRIPATKGCTYRNLDFAQVIGICLAVFAFCDLPPFFRKHALKWVQFLWVL